MSLTALMGVNTATIGAAGQAAPVGAAREVAPAAEEGFPAAVAIIPEIGLWVDGLAQVGFARKTGLVLWWDLGPPPVIAGPGESSIDWRRVAYRIRAEAYEADGRRRARQEALVEPLRSDGSRERGGFPTPLSLPLSPGRYRIRLEAYPLISARAAGLDSVPHGKADIEVTVPEISVGSGGWRTSDLLFLHSARKWEPGAAAERTWYDWIVSPNASRIFAAGGAPAHVAFEILRGAEVVPQCAPGACRVVITFRDSQGGIVHQELRRVPDAGSVSAYLVGFHTDSLAAGTYAVEVETFEGTGLLSSARRDFRVLSRR